MERIRSNLDLNEVDKNLFEAVIIFDKAKFSKIIECSDSLK